MNPNLLIDAIVRQTQVLIAHPVGVTAYVGQNVVRAEPQQEES